MRRSRYSDSQILAILKQTERGIGVPELCREHGMSSAQFYKWRSKFGGMDASMMKRLKELEDENRRLKKNAPEGINMLKKSSRQRLLGRRLKKSGKAIPSQGDGTESLRAVQN